MQVDEEVRKAVGITDNQYINQFPFEACLVMKHHLAETIREVSKFRDQMTGLIFILNLKPKLLCY